MTFLPIIERELRVRARSRATYWSRFAVALTGALTGLPSLISPTPWTSPTAAGQIMFDSMVGAAFLLSCAGCLLTADTISSERRDGTLGLLLLTRVKDRDVLIGKLGSAGLTSLCALVAFLPILMLPLLAGGVTGGEAFRKGLVLLDTMFLALAAGLWASARGHEWLKTGRNALIVVASVVLGPFLAGALLFGKLGAAGATIKYLSPLGALSAAKDVLYNFSGAPYWLSLLVVQAVGWLLLAGAIFRLRRGWQEERGDTAVPAPATAGQGEAEAAPPPCTPLNDDTDPLVWLLQRRRGLRALLWAGALVGLSHYSVIPVLFGLVSSTSYWGVVSPLTLAATIVSGALFAWAASRFFVEARRTGELELLLTTPLGARRLVSTQWKVLKRELRWPLVVMLAPAFLQMVSFMVRVGSTIGPASSFGVHYAVSELIDCVNTIFGVGALCWMGLWFGLRAGGQGRAIIWTVTVVKGLPYLISILSLTLVMALVRSPVGRTSPPYWIMSWVPQLVDLLFYLALIQLARRRLLGQLAAAEPMTADLRQSLTAFVRDAVTAWRKARRWTP